MVGANSPSSLASRPIRILLADEIDRYPATAGNEGDPLLHADCPFSSLRSLLGIFRQPPATQQTGKQGRSSESREPFCQGISQEEWNVPCPVCGEFTPLTWGNIRFDKNNLDEIGHCCPRTRILPAGRKGRPFRSAVRPLPTFPPFRYLSTL